MKTTFKQTLAATALTTMTVTACAAPEPKDPSRQTPQGLYVTATEAWEMMQEDESVVLVDVRTPEEWQFVGYTKEADIMLPAVMFDYSQMDTKQNKARYMPVQNNKWISQFEGIIFDKGYDGDNTYIIMCRSGATRAAPVAKMLDQYGFKNVYTMTDGFQGGRLKEGENEGRRMKAGWINSGLPWTHKIDADKVYFKAYGVSY
jgi:rhodanese-related sulfurtransferase